MNRFKILILAVVAFFATAITAQAEELTMDDLREAVAILNADCPYDAGDGIIISSVTLDKNALTMNMLCDEDDSVIKIIDVMADQFAPMYVEQFKSDPDTEDILRACKREKINLKVVMSNKNGTSATLLAPYTTF